VRGRDAALEIGCGPGRLMRPLAKHFREIHGSTSRTRWCGSRASVCATRRTRFRITAPGSDLAMFADEKFDFVYSFAVFQHIPSRDVVFNYLREARRVLKPAGVLRCQLNGLPPMRSSTTRGTA